MLAAVGYVGLLGPAGQRVLLLAVYGQVPDAVDEGEPVIE